MTMERQHAIMENTTIIGTSAYNEREGEVLAICATATLASMANKGVLHDQKAHPLITNAHSAHYLYHANKHTRSLPSML